MIERDAAGPSPVDARVDLKQAGGGTEGGLSADKDLSRQGP